jgi:hypothetical protein
MHLVNGSIVGGFLQEEKCVLVLPSLKSASHGSGNFILLDFLLHPAKESSSSWHNFFFISWKKFLHLCAQSSSSRGGELRFGLGRIQLG